MRNNTANKPNSSLYKKLFWGLISILLIIFIAIFVAIRLDSPKTEINRINPSSSESLTVSLDKQQINAFSNYYLNKVQAKQTNPRYNFVVKDQGIVYGSMEILGANVDYSMFFDPKVLPDGNMDLKATNLSIGLMPVPIKAVMLYVQTAYKLPKWVKLLPNEKIIHLDNTHMNGNKGINYRATQIDTKGKGKFVFDVVLPNK